jgi:serine/threonine protein kinase
MLTFTCSRCGRLLQVREEHAGRKARCQGCGAVSEVPRSLEAVAARSPAPADVADLPTFVPSGGNGEQPADRAPDPDRGLPEGLLGPPRGPEEIGRLGPYRVFRVLGVGGMGVVLEAVDEQLQRPVALKALLPQLAASASARERFLREARAAAAIDHDHVVTIYQVGEDRGIPYLAMPLLQGETLDTRLRRDRRLGVAEAARVGREVAEGLAAAHRRGVVHRDVKPANIWLETHGSEPGDSSPRYRVKLLDFGLARAAGEGGRLTQSGAVVGTPADMAPEQAGGRAVDERADLFSLGCVVYRCLTGQVPFRGSDTLATLAALATETPRPVRELNPEVPAALAELVERLLAKDPACRPPSARAVAEALAALEPTAPSLTIEPVSGRPDLPTEPLDAVAEPGRPRRLAVLIAGLAALFGLLAVCMAGAGLWALRGVLSGPGPSDLAGKGAHPDRWTVLFRSDDPRLWNTDHRRGDDQFGVPLSRAPALIHHVRLRRLDTGEALIVPITPAQLGAAPAPPPEHGAWWNGTARDEYTGLHLGIAQAPRGHWPNIDGIISVQNDGWDAFGGSGFGHLCMHPNAGQKYCWRGKEIPRTVFEIAVTAEPLTEDEQRCLLPQR